MASSKTCHDVCGRKRPVPMTGKPGGCIETEESLQYQEGDVVIVTFPKTGTTVVQYMCHLLRTEGKHTDFEDIHQVCPHTSSAWFIGQDLNADQIARPRLFKSHRELSQVAAFSSGIKFISTIRDPLATLLSAYSFGKVRKSDPGDASVVEFASSSKWSVEYNKGAITTIFEHFATFWQCRECSDILLLPYEDLVVDRPKWLIKIGKFMNIPESSLTSDIIENISQMTSKESMLALVSKFDESWCKSERERLARPHPIIKDTAAKVTSGQDHLLADSSPPVSSSIAPSSQPSQPSQASQTSHLFGGASGASSSSGSSSVKTGDEARNAVGDGAATRPSVKEQLIALNDRLWKEKVEAVTGIRSYQEMRNLLVSFHFPA